MAFWSDTTLDPKRAFKFKVSFSRINGNATFLAQTADRPQFTISDGTKVDFLDKAFHFPGKVTWEPVKIKFVDGSADTNVSKDSYSYLASAGWVAPDAFNPGSSASNLFRTIGKNSAKIQAGTVSIDVLNSVGTSVDKWTLNNAFITKATFNPLNYGGEDILTVEYTFRYDWATLVAI